MTAPAAPVSAHLDVDPTAIGTRWRGHMVRVQARLLPRTLYTAADITVEVDGVVVLHTGGQRKITGSVRERFRNDGVDHGVELAWGAGTSGRGFPVTVTIDDDVVVNGDFVRLQNPRAVFGVALSMLVLIGAGALLALLSAP